MDTKIAAQKTVTFLRKFWPAILVISAVGGVGLYLESWLDVRSVVSDRKVTSSTVRRLNRQLREMRTRLETIAQDRESAALDERKPSAFGPVRPSSKPVKYLPSGDSLLSSIARSPSEVIELQKQGDRDYEVFQLGQGRARRIGPVRVALKRTDSAHQKYDVEVKTQRGSVVKKNVKRLERVLVPIDARRNAELVVNQVSDDQVVGYLGTPREMESKAGL